jgi:hypothetical protein
MTSSDMPKNYEVFVISDDDDEVAQPAPKAKPVPEVKPAPEAKPVPEVKPAPEAKPVPEVKPAPKAKPAKRKHVSNATLQGWRQNCACEDPDAAIENCNCQAYRDFLEWEKKCTCQTMYIGSCKCLARKAKKKEEY